MFGKTYVKFQIIGLTQKNNKLRTWLFTSCLISHFYTFKLFRSVLKYSKHGYVFLQEEYNYPVILPMTIMANIKMGKCLLLTALMSKVSLIFMLHGMRDHTVFIQQVQRLHKNIIILVLIHRHYYIVITCLH